MPILKIDSTHPSAQNKKKSNYLTRSCNISAPDIILIVSPNSVLQVIDPACLVIAEYYIYSLLCLSHPQSHFSFFIQSKIHWVWLKGNTASYIKSSLHFLHMTEKQTHKEAPATLCVYKDRNFALRNKIKLLIGTFSVKDFPIHLMNLMPFTKATPLTTWLIHMTFLLWWNPHHHH